MLLVLVSENGISTLTIVLQLDDVVALLRGIQRILLSINLDFTLNERSDSSHVLISSRELRIVLHVLPGAFANRSRPCTEILAGHLGCRGQIRILDALAFINIKGLQHVAGLVLEGEGEQLQIFVHRIDGPVAAHIGDILRPADKLLAGDFRNLAGRGRRRTAAPLGDGRRPENFAVQVNKRNRERRSVRAFIFVFTTGVNRTGSGILGIAALGGGVLYIIAFGGDGSVVLGVVLGGSFVVLITAAGNQKQHSSQSHNQRNGKLGPHFHVSSP